MLGTKVPWVWDKAQTTAFDSLKKALCEAPVLCLPNLAGNFVLETDASDNCLGAVISQDQGEGPQPVAYMSKKLVGAPLNYATHEREMMAVVVAVKKWHCYLDGKSQRSLLTTVH